MSIQSVFSSNRSAFHKKINCTCKQQTSFRNAVPAMGKRLLRFVLFIILGRNSPHFIYPNSGSDLSFLSNLSACGKPHHRAALDKTLYSLGSQAVLYKYGGAMPHITHRPSGLRYKICEPAFGLHLRFWQSTRPSFFAKGYYSKYSGFCKIFPYISRRYLIQTRFCSSIRHFSAGFLSVTQSQS